MKEKFKLPEVFWIHSFNLEQTNIVTDWYNSKYGNRFSHTSTGEYFHPNKNHPGMYGTSIKPTDVYPIITFQEFEKYVLNKSIKEISEDYSHLILLLKKLNIK